MRYNNATYCLKEVVTKAGLTVSLQSNIFRGRHGRDRMIVGFTTKQSVPITINIVSLNRVHGEVCSIQHYVIKFASGWWQGGGFLLVLWFPPSIKLTAMI